MIMMLMMMRTMAMTMVMIRCVTANGVGERGTQGKTFIADERRVHLLGLGARLLVEGVLHRVHVLAHVDFHIGAHNKVYDEYDDDGEVV